MNTANIRTGESILIAPDLTGADKWLSGNVIEVEHNSFVGNVITAEAEDGDIYFGREYSFKKG